MQKRAILLTFVSIMCASLFGAFVGCSSAGGGGGSDQELPVTLATPFVSVEGNIASWQAVENAQGYDVYVDGNLAVSTAQTTYTLSVTEAGEYVVRVRATTTKQGFLSSALSEPVTYTKAEEVPVALARPVLSCSGNVISWQAVENAESYSVHIDGRLVDTVTATSYTVTVVKDGSYTVTVVATTTQAGYSDSDPGMYLYIKVTPVPLAAPVIELSENVVSWQAIEGAESYIVYINSEETATVTQTTYTILVDEDGEYSVTVKATTTQQGKLPSQLSQAVMYIKETPPPEPVAISAPSVSAIGYVLSWQKVDHAGSYDIYIDGSKQSTVSALELDVSELAPGEHTIQVMAMPRENSGYLPSEKSAGITVNVVKKLYRIRKTADPDITEYWTDGSGELDLTGLTVMADYKNAESEPITLTADNVLSEYDLTVAGRYELQFGYQGFYGVTVRINVRTPSVAAAELTVYNMLSYTEGAWIFAYDGYDISDGSFTAVSAQKVGGTAITVTDGKAAKSDLSEGENLLRVYDGTNYHVVMVIVARGISKAEEFALMDSDLTGYYALTCDIDFEKKNGTKIGNAPLSITWSATNLTCADTIHVDRTGVGTANDGSGASLDGIALGRAFTGVFDGRGYVLKNYKLKLNTSSYLLRHKGYGKGMFGWIGKTGVVKNFTLNGAEVYGDDYSALIAGYNEGRIENIAIEDDCYIFNFYSHGAIISALNYGLVKNVCTLTTKGETNYSSGPVEFAFLHRDGDYTGESGINCYVGDTTDRTAALGEGWRYIPGYGNLYVNNGFKRLISYESVWVANVPTLVTLFIADSGVTGAYFHSWGTFGGAVSIKSRSEDRATGMFEYMLSIPSGTPGAGCTIKMKFDSVSYFCPMSVTVGDPFVTGIEPKSDTVIETVAGSGINLNNIPINLIYTDGSRVEGVPTGYIASTYNSALENTTQKVTFFYEVDGEFHYAIIKVKPVPSAVNYVESIAVALKDGVGRIKYSAASPTVSFDSYLNFALVYRDGTTEAVTAASAGITAGTFTPGRHAVTFSYNDSEIGLVTKDITLDIWYVIASADDWKLMNTYLDGYFMLEADLALTAQTDNSLVIGRAPLKQLSEGYGIDAAGVGPVLAGIAFTGRFDGGGFTVSGFNTNFERNTGATQPWQPTSYALVPFAFVGEGGVVENFTLASAAIRAGQCGSLVAGLNMGTIKNVTVASDCTLFIHYGGPDAGAIAVVNCGTIQSAVCRVTQITAITSGVLTTYNLTRVVNSSVDGTETECTVGQEV